MKYLVPYDFTPVTHSALQHALKICETQSGQVQLLHIIPDENERLNAEHQFTNLMAELTTRERDCITTKVRVGNIFKDISRESEEGEFQLLIMGTHGATGLQKLLGSHAIKVITSAKTPFIVTQLKKPKDSIERIILPVDLSHESIQITRFASDLAKKFNAGVHIVCQPRKDEFLHKKLQNNILKVRRQLDKNGINYSYSVLPGKESYHKEVIHYGGQLNADMFAIAHYSETLLPQFEKFSQALITNKFEIPVLIINASEVLKVRTNYSFVGI